MSYVLVYDRVQGIKQHKQKEKHYDACHPWDICGLSIEQHK
jgi:hypothetical protein